MASHRLSRRQELDGSTTGRTRWRVFALVLVVGVFGAGLMLTGMSQGAIAASFAVSGTRYKASADDLRAEGVVQYGSVDRGSGKPHPVLVNGFRDARLSNFCQSIVVPGIPGIGDMTIRISAPGGMRAENLVIGVQEVTGDLTLNDVEIGRDAATFDEGPAGLRGEPGTFGIQADSAHIADLRQVAWSTTASTLRLDDVRITATAGHDECF
ncbi:DUF6230 family protein [Haloactinomyces albus]|uniref:Cholesterol esterase n=1 Tax=Haloactinomyces albus TaxID=1352928 RepID=A0AAE4CMH3_9ACTN|nr:DUF6230 family protein [Haloactinomyces albus]MDR7300972.1 hypothetical protein [Haloactinomyces albus]